MSLTNAALAAPATRFRLAGFSAALASGWQALRTSVRAVLAGAGYVLPFAAVAVALL